MKTSRRPLPLPALLAAALVVVAAPISNLHATQQEEDAWHNGINSFLPGFKSITDIGFSAYHVTKRMDERQKEVARERAKQINSDPAASKHRYVAVPVPKQDGEKKGNSGSDLTVIDTKTGQPVDDNTYVVTKKSDLKNGNTVKLGDMDAYVMNTDNAI